jgi:hypothetical protein
MRYWATGSPKTTLKNYKMETKEIIAQLEAILAQLRERMLTEPEPEALKSIMAARRIAAAIKDLK